MREVAGARDYILKNAPDTAHTNDEWQFLRGQLDGFDTMLKYQQVNEAELKELMNLAANGPDAYADVNPLEM